MRLESIAHPFIGHKTVSSHRTATITSQQPCISTEDHQKIAPWRRICLSTRCRSIITVNVAHVVQELSGTRPAGPNQRAAQCWQRGPKTPTFNTGMTYRDYPVCDMMNHSPRNPCREDAPLPTRTTASSASTSGALRTPQSMMVGLHSFGCPPYTICHGACRKGE